MKRILSVFFFISLFHLSLLAGSIGKLNVLRCEYLVAPLGIDVPSPRLSWQLPVDVDVQEAYQVIVGTDSVRVAQGMGDSWNSGKQTISNVLLFMPDKNFNLIHDITGRCVSGIVIRCIQVT